MRAGRRDREQRDDGDDHGLHGVPHCPPPCVLHYMVAKAMPRLARCAPHEREVLVDASGKQ